MINRNGYAVLCAVYLGLIVDDAYAANCDLPVNLLKNPTFDSGLSDYTTVGHWVFNQSLNPGIYGTFYSSRAAVENSNAAPSGDEATNYPSASLGAFALNEADGANDELVPGQVAGSYVSFADGKLHVYFDFGWRQAGGSPTSAASLGVKVGTTTYLTITSVAGNSPGNATGALSNGAALGANGTLIYTNTGGAGALSRWYTVPLIVPFSGASMPDITFTMSGGGGASDDFALDRLFVPVCAVAPLQVETIVTAVSDPIHDIVDPNVLPGSILRFCTIVTNPVGNAHASNVALTDDVGSLPMTFVPGTIRVNGTVTDGDCNLDGVVGGSIASGVVSGTISSLPAGATRTYYFEMELD